MTDLERRLRDTYRAALDSIEATDRLDDISIPARTRRAPLWRRPVLAFGAAGLATLLVVGGIAVFGPGGVTSQPVATVTANEVLHDAAAGTLTEIRFPDTSIVGVGGVGGSPATIALTGSRDPVLRIMVAPGRWEENPMDGWQPSQSMAGFGSDGDGLAIVLGSADDRFEIRATTDGAVWTRYGFSPSTASRSFGDPLADRSTHVEDVSVDAGRVTVLIGTNPEVNTAALEDALGALGRDEADQAIDQVLSWGPEGISIRFSNGIESVFTLAELGVDPTWVYPAWEVWVTEPDGSTRGIPVDGARFTPLQPTEWTPVTATSALDELFVGGFDPDGVAVLKISDLATGAIEPFTELNLGDWIDEPMAPLRSVMALRTADAVPVAGVSGQEIGIALRLFDALTAWDVPGGSDLAITEMAVRGNTVITVGYPGVSVTRSEFTSSGFTRASVEADFGISDRHPTHISLTDDGLIALPQAGDDPSSFGSDGSAWLIVLAVPGSEPSS